MQFVVLGYVAVGATFWADFSTTLIFYHYDDLNEKGCSQILTDGKKKRKQSTK